MSNFYEVKSLTDRYLVDFHDETLAIASEYDSDKAHTPWDWELRPLHHDTINRDPGMDEEALMDQREFGQHSAALSTPQDYLTCSLYLGEDYRCHLSGATRMLNMTPDSTFSAGGLREATSWLCLRQDIYISLVSEEPLRTDLDKFSNSRVFDLDNDYSWANKMVLLLAKLLSCAFPHDEQLHSASMVEKIRDISQKIDEWWITKPQSFEPLRFVPRKGGRVEGNRFPEIWMLSHVHALLNRPLATSAYENLLNGRAIEV
ncbi:hypothetical protein EIK77_000514 [Talaromyces pinophilus]|nr:hypothetical protein EIK77_000514 [Talaromyces pinophilus]